MSSRKLIVYPNCSKGGVCSVMRARAKHEPGVHFDLVFFNDRGGAHAYDDIDNVSVRIVSKNRSEAYLVFITTHFNYEEVSILSAPETANTLAKNPNLVVTYEFHSSNMDIVEKELNSLDLDKVAMFTAPTIQMVESIKSIMSPKIRLRAKVRENLVDTQIFNSKKKFNYFSRSKFDCDYEGTPLLWVGRLDSGKGYSYLIRVLAMLPEHYHAIIIVSLEDDVSRINNFYSECYAMGVQNRIRVLKDLSQMEMANLYTSVGKSGGFLVSTSLMESFGYSVIEALESNVKVVAFDLPVWENFNSYKEFYRVPSGDVHGMSKVLTEMSCYATKNEKNLIAQ